jgi:molybdenum cofactor cytidylyltransferase
MSADSAPVGAVPSPPAIAGLILAAGESSRMGADKPLLIYRGRTFLETLIATLHESGIERVVVVLGHHAEEIKQSVNLAAAEVVVNHDYRLGQTSSLQAGLRALQGNEPDGIVMCLVDHPAISADTVRQLVRQFKSSGKPVIIPEFHGRHGHPILVGKELLSQFRALGPGEGADTVIRRHRDGTQFVAVSDPGILLDIDDPEAYRQLTAQA